MVEGKRLKELSKYLSFVFDKGNIADKAVATEIFDQCKPAVVANLAVQAGVRYSITNTDAYIKVMLYSIDDKVDNPVCLYVRQKSNELSAHAYYKLYNIPSSVVCFLLCTGRQVIRT